jgi:hypothetical protein
MRQASSWTRSDWERLAADPDPSQDLGYDQTEWDVVEANNTAGQLIFLPTDEDVLKDDAFIVADPASVCDVRDRL